MSTIFYSQEDWDERMSMSLRDTIRGISDSRLVIDDWYWNKIQQHHLIMRLEKPGFVIGEEDREIIWAAVLNYHALEVADWMMERDLPATGMIPVKTSKWPSWVAGVLQTRQMEVFDFIFTEYGKEPMMGYMKRRGYIQNV